MYIYIHTSYGPRIEDIAENKHHRFSIPMGAGGPRLATHTKKNRLPFDERFKQIALWFQMISVCVGCSFSGSCFNLGPSESPASESPGHRWRENKSSMDRWPRQRRCRHSPSYNADLVLGPGNVNTYNSTAYMLPFLRLAHCPEPD